MTITTRWEKRTYDVWGNARDGYEVNDSYSHGEIELEAEVDIVNFRSHREFQEAYLTESQIKEAFGLSSNTGIILDGDDVHITINRDHDGYPIGELSCVSHESLSPIKPKA